MAKRVNHLVQPFLGLLYFFMRLLNQYAATEDTTPFRVPFSRILFFLTLRKLYLQCFNYILFPNPRLGALLFWINTYVKYSERRTFSLLISLITRSISCINNNGFHKDKQASLATGISEIFIASRDFNP